MAHRLSVAEDNYLSIARTVLKAARVPMTPKHILESAYVDELVPHHLHGRTQHKTLQARLSEDILRRRDRSAFFRSAPGKFFLREFIDDESIPPQFRKPIVARRRVRDLPKKGALTIDRATVEARRSNQDVSDTEFADWIKSDHFRYVRNAQTRSPDDILVWTFVVVVKGSSILSYRHGQYREGRDSFLRKRCIGFYNLVTDDDITLFDRDDLGVLNSGLKAVSMDLDIPVDQLENTDRPNRVGFIYTPADESSDLLGLIMCRCPDWFEPLGRRLSLNDLTWIDAKHAPNNIDDFDPWSQMVFDRVRANVLAA